jgi:hypothetical protein
MLAMIFIKLKDAIEKQLMEVDVEIDRPTKSLNQSLLSHRLQTDNFVVCGDASIG